MNGSVTPAHCAGDPSTTNPYSNVSPQAPTLTVTVAYPSRCSDEDRSQIRSPESQKNSLVSQKDRLTPKNVFQNLLMKRIEREVSEEGNPLGEDWGTQTGGGGGGAPSSRQLLLGAHISDAHRSASSSSSSSASSIAWLSAPCDDTSAARSPTATLALEEVGVERSSRTEGLQDDSSSSSSSASRSSDKKQSSSDNEVDGEDDNAPHHNNVPLLRVSGASPGLRLSAEMQSMDNEMRSRSVGSSAAPPPPSPRDVNVDECRNEEANEKAATILQRVGGKQQYIAIMRSIFTE